MTFPEGILDDYLLFDGALAITLSVRVTESTFTDHALVRAHRGSATRTLDDGLRQRVTTWRLWARELDRAGAPAPKVGDVVTQSDGTGWVLEDVPADAFDGAYLCTVRKLVTATG